MTFTYLCIIDDYFGDVLGNIDQILKGDHPIYANLNMSDDNMLLSTDTKFLDHLSLIARDKNRRLSPYFKLEEQTSATFGGDVVYVNESNQISLCKNIVSLLKNKLVPERGVDPSFFIPRGQDWVEWIKTSKGKLWPLGWLTINEVFGDSPRFADAYGIFNDIFKYYYNTYPEHYAKAWLDRNPIPLPPNLDENDLIVIFKPEVLEYKFDLTEVNKEVVDSFYSVLQPESFEQELRKIIRG